MIKAILFDLDNTLLKNPGLPFVQEYLRLGDEHFSRAWGYSGFPEIALGIMHAMNGKRTDPQETNAQLAIRMIAAAANRELNETAAELQKFYDETYASLQPYITPVERAGEIIATLRDAGYEIVIATNPIYPPAAICQRLRWGGLRVDLEQYSFVTHAENMHFAKPDLAYYAEILARVGAEPDEAIMVGDNPENDIRPAASLGIQTYQIVPEMRSDPDGNSGTLQDFCVTVMKGAWQKTLSTPSLDPKMIEPQLRGNVGALFGLLDSAKPHFWNQHPDPNEWSPLQIVCHLWESEDTVQQPRLQRILTDDNPFLVAPKEPFGPKKYHCVDAGIDYAKKFAAARQKTIHWLQTLDQDDWYRPARHSIFGPTTLLEMAHFTAQHDRLHLNQLCRTLGNCE